MTIKKQTQRFTLFEEMTNDMFEDNESQSNYTFPKKRVLRLKLDIGSRVGLKEILTYFDNLLLNAVMPQNVERWVRCRKCQTNCKTGYFFVREAFDVDDDMQRCKPNDVHEIGVFSYRRYLQPDWKCPSKESNIPV